jgi:uracil-DNA glycosylase family 4
MTATTARRAQVLQALGIEQWQLRRADAHAAPVTTAATAPIPVAPVPASPAAVMPAVPEPAAARTAAVPSADWERLAAEVRGCQRCALHATRTQTVFGVGDRGSDLLVVGEAPGAEEDRQGEPFVGRAGQLLNSMLRAMGTPRASVYIANLLKCRPPGNRDPAVEEVACCQPYLQRQIELLQPRLVLAVGRIAAQNLLATDRPIGKLRGSVHSYGAGAIPLVVTYHPAYLLRSPTEKRKAWTDLSLARRELARLRAAATAS